MPLLDFDFKEVPDEIKSVPAGKYTFEILDPPSIEPTQKGDANNLIIQFTIKDEGDYYGRKIKHYFYLGNEIGLVQVKRMLKACGIDPANWTNNTEDLIGKVCEAVVVEGSFKDKETGEDISRPNIKTFVV